MSESRLFVLALCLSFPALGCAYAEQLASNPVPTVRKRAAFDMDCPVDAIEAIQFEDSTQRNAVYAERIKTFGVEACGRRATYVSTCTAGMGLERRCLVRQDSPPTAMSSRPAAQAPQSAPVVTTPPPAEPAAEPWAPNEETCAKYPESMSVDLMDPYGEQLAQYNHCRAWEAESKE